MLGRHLAPLFGIKAVRIRRLLSAIWLLVAAGMSLPSAGAGVVVLTNRAKDKVSFTVVQPDGRQTQQELLHDDVVSVPTAGSVTVAFQDGAEPRRYLLRANGIYYFRTDGQEARSAATADSRPFAPPGQHPGVEAVGQPAGFVVYHFRQTSGGRERAAGPPALGEGVPRAACRGLGGFRTCCRIRFQVVAVETWTSGDNVHDFLRLMNEFERQVKPEPARLAIGFTGQYARLQEDKRMGGARGPFRSHVLIREWGRQITESERLEILVHELGHYLGAVHSPEPQSVMRPDFSDRQSRARSYRIRFDAPNTLIMCLLGEEFRSRPFVHLGQLPAAVKGQLRPLYQSLAAGLPNDPAAPRYLAMLDQSLGLAGAAADHRQAVIAGARSVVQAVTEAARENDPSVRRRSPA